MSQISPDKLAHIKALFAKLTPEWQTRVRATLVTLRISTERDSTPPPPPIPDGHLAQAVLLEDGKVTTQLTVQHAGQPVPIDPDNPDKELDQLYDLSRRLARDPVKTDTDGTTIRAPIT